MTTNDGLSRITRLSSRLVVGIFGAAALASAACGGDDNQTLAQEIAADGADSGAGTSSTHTSTSSSTNSSSTTSTNARTTTTTTTDAGEPADSSSIVSVDITADAGACKQVTGLFKLSPTAGSSPLCPAVPVLCSVATDLLSCEVKTQCELPDGGLSGLGDLFSIPVEVLGPTNDINYTTSIPLLSLGGVSAGTLAAGCSLTFGDDSVSLGLSCTGTVPVVGNVAVCAYASAPIDGGL